MSQHDLSIEADIPKNQIGRIERAEINTTVITLHKIASALNVDVASLVNPHSNQT
ncbi:helix-turn-helix domain-containing protein [Muricauda sp. HICW]|uniref:Helix-turn-helix domain-containing protein n=2 Tax=Flagellimonas chongwuensis TaxID=2697365 RepID=A0A850NC49_9FLAO|nr:helix-turn-helix domain-containing protein [Allomuricauda chongwuensis]